MQSIFSGVFNSFNVIPGGITDPKTHHLKKQRVTPWGGSLFLKVVLVFEH
jgi:hypothetical protein